MDVLFALMTCDTLKIQIITRDNPFYFGADIVFAVMWFWFLSYAIWNNLRICIFILRKVNLLPHLSLF